MEKILSLKSDRDFKKVYNSKKKAYNKSFIVYYLKHNRDFSRFGFAISKKYGKANKRNLIRRRLKYIICQNMDEIKNGYDIVVIPKYHIIDYDFKKIQKEFLAMLNYIKVLKG